MEHRFACGCYKGDSGSQWWVDLFRFKMADNDGIGIGIDIDIGIDIGIGIDVGIGFSIDIGIE